MAPLSSWARVSPGMANEPLVSVVGSSVLISSRPTGVPLAVAKAPRAATEAVVETFHSTLSALRPSVVREAGAISGLKGMPG